MPRARAAVLLTATVAGLGACAVVKRPADWRAQPEPRDVSTATFALPPALTIGFDALSSQRPWRVGDRIVVGVQFDNRDDVRTWFVSAEIVDWAQDAGYRRHGDVRVPAATHWRFTPGGNMLGGTARVHIDVHDASGRLLDTQIDDLAGLAFVEQSDVHRAVGLGVDALLELVMSVDALRDVLMDVARKPTNWWQLLVRGGVNVTGQIGWPKQRAVRKRVTAFGEQRTVWVPLALDANDEPALDCEVLFCWKRSPILLTAGALEIQARHPDDPRRRVTIRLLGARSGPETDPPISRR